MCLIAGIGASYILMFESARKFVKKSAMLQESWQQCFPWPYLLYVTVVGQMVKAPNSGGSTGDKGGNGPPKFYWPLRWPQFSRKVHNF